MTRATVRMKIALAFALAVAGLAGSAVRLDRSARADGPQAKPAERRAGAAPAVWSIEGILVDEQGRPFPGASLRAVADDRVTDESKSDAEGAFTLALGGRTPYIRGVIAETDGGSRIGLVRFDQVREPRAQDPVRIVLKPSRQVKVRVSDTAGSPVPGAAVEAIDPSFQTHATTGPDGTATLRVAADAKIRWVFGLKSGAGFDYFENYRSTPPVDYPPLAADVSLTLDGADTVRVKAVDSAGLPVSGVEFRPANLFKIGKVRNASFRLCASTKATTDGAGIATFDWLPKGAAGAGFDIVHGGIYSSRDRPHYRRGGPYEMTAHVLREARLGGTVIFPDGRPAEGILIKAEGGPRSGAAI
jgi:hypothetical protein